MGDALYQRVILSGQNFDEGKNLSRRQTKTGKHDCCFRIRKKLYVTLAHPLGCEVLTCKSTRRAKQSGGLFNFLRMPFGTRGKPRPWLISVNSIVPVRWRFMIDGLLGVPWQAAAQARMIGQFARMGRPAAPVEIGRCRGGCAALRARADRHGDHVLFEAFVVANAGIAAGREDIDEACRRPVVRRCSTRTPSGCRASGLKQQAARARPDSHTARARRRSTARSPCKAARY